MKLLTRSITAIDHEATGKAARKERLSKGESLRSVASAMGISAPYLSDLERGNRAWSKELLNRFTSALSSINHTQTQP